MDLSTFQLVDAINDMDMLRNLSGQEQYNKPQQSQQQQPQQQQQAYQQLQGDIDLLFEPNHPSSNNQFMNQQHQEAPMLTPLISPAMTPSFNYHHHQKFNNANDVDFSPLSSPAIMPQMDQARYPQKPIYQEQQQRQQHQQQQYTTNRQDSFENLSANQICEQYEQLEQAKLLITQKLSELQKTQRQHYTGSSPSSSSSSSGVYSKHALIHSTAMLDNNNGQMSTPNSPSQSPHMEPATPASLMNMKLSNAQPSKLHFSSSTNNHINRATSNQSLNFYSNNNSSTPVSFAPSSTPSSSNSNHIFQSPILTSTPNNHDSIMSPMITPPSSKSSSKSKVPPPSPLALNPRQSTTSNRNTPKEKSLRPSSKKQRRESSSTEQSKSNSTVHASPRALKPLLISPTLNPGLKPLPSALLPSSSSSHNNRVSSVEDAERILATRSNYQNLMEGKGAALGIAFSTQIKSGLEVRRTAHKAAEQKRRDSLKEWFDRLRREVEDGYVKRQKTLMSRVMKAQELEKNTSNKQQQQRGEDDEMTDAAAEDESTDLKPLSKVLLLQYAYEYISSLKKSLQERDATIEKLKQGCNDNDDNEKTATLKRKLSPEEDSASTSNSSADDSIEAHGEI